MELKRQSFTINEYRELINSIISGGYNFIFYEEDDGSDDVVFLRHDIDKSVKKALEIAAIDYELGVRSNFFFLTRCSLYSLLEPDTVNIINEISKMGHAIGLHLDERQVSAACLEDSKNLSDLIENEFLLMEKILDLPISRVFSFHNPFQESLKYDFSQDNFLSTYGSQFMMPNTKYISDSNAFWREGDPKEYLAAKNWQRVQILLHPIWWTQSVPKNVIKILLEILESRNSELKKYLKYSNDLFSEYLRSIERK